MINAETNLSNSEIEMTKYLYSLQIKRTMETCGTAHITSELPTSGNHKIQWIGWSKIQELHLPYFKEELSKIAYNQYKNIKS